MVSLLNCTHTGTLCKPTQSCSIFIYFLGLIPPIYLLHWCPAVLPHPLFWAVLLFPAFLSCMSNISNLCLVMSAGLDNIHIHIHSFESAPCSPVAIMRMNNIPIKFLLTLTVRSNICQGGVVWDKPAKSPVYGAVVHFTVLWSQEGGIYWFMATWWPVPYSWGRWGAIYDPLCSGKF